MGFFILAGSNHSWRSPPFIIQDIYSRILKKKLAYPECCKQAKNIGKPLKNLDIYSPQFHTKTNWTTCRDTSHLRAEHLLLFTPYSSTVYINQIHPYYFTHESRAHFLQYLEPLYSYLIPYYPIIWVIWIWVWGSEDGASIPESLPDGSWWFAGHSTILDLSPSPADLYF